MPSRIRTGTRLHYCRYADDWIVGIIGSSSLARNLKDEINTFLKEVLKLTLSLEKTKITNVQKKRALFLGTEIHVPNPRESKVVIRRMKDGNKIAARANHVRVYLEAPIGKIHKGLQKEGFIKDDGITPQAMTK